MSSWKCHNCGLVNFAGIESCRRCQISATGGHTASQYGQGDFQVNRPPQQGSPVAPYIAPPTNHQTANRPAPPAGNYPQNDHQQNPYTPGDNPTQSFGYASQQPYTQHSPSYDSQPNKIFHQVYSTGYGRPVRGIYRDNNHLLMHRQAQLPDLCVKCNAPTKGFYQSRQLSCIPQGGTALLLASTLIFFLLGFIGYVMVKQKAVVKLGLCQQHQSSRRTNQIIGWATIIMGVVVMVSSFYYGEVLVLLLSFAMIIGGAIIARMAAKVVTAVKMNDEYIWLTRISKDFLANFPSSASL